MILNRLVHTVSIDSVAGMQPCGTVERKREIECVWFGDVIAFKMDVVYSSSSLKMLSLLLQFRRSRTDGGRIHTDSRPAEQQSAKIRIKNHIKLNTKNIPSMQPLYKD